MKQPRFASALVLCLLGLLLNNYWILAPFLGIPSNHLVSVLGMNGEPHAMLFRELSVLAGLSLIASVAVARRRAKHRQLLTWLLVAIGACIIIDGLFAINCDACTLNRLNFEGWVHGIESVVYVVLILVGTILTIKWRLNRKVALLQLAFMVIYLAMHAMVLLSLKSGGPELQRVTLGIETILLFLIWWDAVHATKHLQSTNHRILSR